MSRPVCSGFILTQASAQTPRANLGTCPREVTIPSAPTCAGHNRRFYRNNRLVGGTGGESSMAQRQWVWGVGAQ